MSTTVHYSRRKLLVMAALCAVGLPLLSPLMLATGPGAVVLIPLFLIGGPIVAVPCLVRAAGDLRAVDLGAQDVTLRALWRTHQAPLTELVDVRLEQDTVRWMLFVPLSRKVHLVLDLGVDGVAHRTVRLPLNLLDLDEPGAHAFVRGVKTFLERRVRGRY